MDKLREEALNHADDTTLLLGETDVPPVREYNEQGRSPFLLTCDHYGRLIPRVLGDLGLPESELTRHIAWDIGIAGVAEMLSKHLDAHLIVQRYSRLVIDCNRPPHVASSIPLISEATTVPGNEGITREQAAVRRAEIFDPYHQPHRRDHRRAPARQHADDPGLAAQFHAGLCRHRAAMAHRHALPARQGAADAAARGAARRA